MVENNSFSFTLRVIIGVAALGVALYFVHMARGFIVPLMLAVLVVLSASPLYYWLREKKAPGWLAFALTMVAIFAVLGFLAVVLIVAVERLVELIPTYSEEIDSFKEGVTDFLSGLGLGQSNASDTAQLIDPGVVLDFYAGLLGVVAEGFSSTILVFMAIIFLLLEAADMPNKMAAELKTGNETVRRLSEFSIDIRRYISITTWIGLATGAVDTVFFVIMGVPLPLLWGLLAFLLSYIPVIGFWLAAIPPTLLMLLESGPAAAIVVFFGIVIINGLADEVLKPKFMGVGLDLAPFMVIMSVTFWTAILGPLGAILGVPVTVTFKELVLEADEQNSWIARFMGKGGHKPPAGDTSEGEPQAAAGNE